MTRPNISFEKIASDTERDVAQLVRNQVTIDRMKSLTPKGKLMVQLRRHPFEYAALGASLLLIASVVIARAEDPAPPPRITCPTAGEPCRILLLSPQEEKMLMGQNGILDTAAQARSLDLGQFAVYLKTRIAAAPAGEIKPVPQPPTDIAPKDVKPN